MKFSAKRSMIKRLLGIALTVVIMAGFVPVHANAYSPKYKVANLQQNKVITALPYDFDYDTYDDIYHLYRISVPVNGFVKIVVSNASADVKIYKSIDWSKYLYESNCIIRSYGKKVHYAVLPKGTYYLEVGEKTKLKWTFTSMPNKTNYCRARAAALKSGKKPLIMFNYRYDHDRWYKIRITKRKKITISLKTLDADYNDIYFTLVNFRGIRIKCPQLRGNTYQTAVVPPGVYYICLERNDYNSDDKYYGNRLCQLCWK